MISPPSLACFLASNIERLGGAWGQGYTVVINKYTDLKSLDGVKTRMKQQGRNILLLVQGGLLLVRHLLHVIYVQHVIKIFQASPPP